MMMKSVFFSRCFPGCPRVNLNLPTVYSHIDAVIMCSDWDPDPPNILESDIVFFSSYMLPKIVTVTTLLLFGHVALLDILFYFVEWRTCVVISYQTNTPSICNVGLSVHTDPDLQYCASDTIPEACQRRSKKSPHAASETFTQRWRRRIGAGYPHLSSSVNGASDTCKHGCSYRHWLMDTWTHHNVQFTVLLILIVWPPFNSRLHHFCHGLREMRRISEV